MEWDMEGRREHAEEGGGRNKQQSWGWDFIDTHASVDSASKSKSGMFLIDYWSVWFSAAWS